MQSFENPFNFIVSLDRAECHELTCGGLASVEPTENTRAITATFIQGIPRQSCWNSRKIVNETGIVLIAVVGRIDNVLGQPVRDGETTVDSVLQLPDSLLHADQRFGGGGVVNILEGHPLGKWQLRRELDLRDRWS